MSRPLVVLRPEPGLSATMAAARAGGIAAVRSALFVIEPVAWELPEPRVFDALLAGSANAFRQGGEGLAALHALPVYAVGERTAAAAREMGFTVAKVGSGGLQTLVDTLVAPQRLLRLAGEARVTLLPPSGIEITERVAYRAEPQPLSATAADTLRHGAVAMLHSAEAARQFASECDRLALPRGGIAIAAIGARVAAAAGPGWQSVAVAPRPAEGPLLALATKMCQ